MKMLLIDGNSMLFRGFYATYYSNLMKTSTGVYTNAVFAFANMLNKAIDMIHPEYCVVAFDKGKHTFRHELSADYKGTRKSAPEELVPQFAMIREYLAAYNIPFLEYDDIEADDIIGSIAKQYPNVDMCVLSSDRDLLQLIDNTTTVYLMKKGISDLACMDEKALISEWGIKPNQVPDLKGLMGDSSDNIKGVAGIGPKTATKLLQEYHDIEGIYNHIEDLKGKVKENLLRDKDSCFLSKLLATIKTDVVIDRNLDEFKIDLNIDGVNEFYTKYEMFSLRKTISKKVKEVSFKRVAEVSDEALNANAFIYVDTDEFSYYEPKIYGIAFANDEVCEYIPFEDLVNDEKALAFLASDVKKLTYNLKFIKHAFDYYGLNLGNQYDDLMLMSFLKNNYLDNLNDIFNAYSKEVVVDITEIYGTQKKNKLIDTIAQTNRACLIANNFKDIYPKLLNELKNNDLYDLYLNIELPLTYVLYDMEKEGIRCDSKVIEEIGIETEKHIDEISQNIYAMVKHEFNLNSPKQLAEVLFDELGLPSNKKRSTSIEYLQKIEDYHPIVSELMKYRKYAKLYSSYVEGLSRYIQTDHKIHTIFSQTITQTGRLSSYDPNLQNISVRDKEGRNIRKAFTASSLDRVLISSDYSQIELRVLASMADEKKMIDAFNHGIDIHTKTAMDIFGLSFEEVNEDIRRRAKAINFGVVYGISDFGLSKQTSLTVKESKRFIDEYFKTYPNIKRFIDESIKYCQDKGYVTTLMKRRRYINEINDSNYMIKEFGKRAAVNSRVQGSAADLIKIAMIKIHNEINKRGLKSRLVLQIHDELIFDVFKDEENEMIDIIKEGMKHAMNLNVTLDSSLNVAYSWYDAK